MKRNVLLEGHKVGRKLYSRKREEVVQEADKKIYKVPPWEQERGC